MAYAKVQSASSSGASPNSASFTSFPTQGNLLIAVVQDTTSATQPVVSDTLNGSWTLLKTQTRSATLTIYVFGIIAGASQPKAVTITQGTDAVAEIIYEFSGGPATLTSITDGNAGASGAATLNNAGSQPSITTTNAGDLVLTVVGIGSSATSGEAFTSPFNTNLSQVGSALMWASYNIPGTAGTNNPSSSWNNSRSWVQITIAFVPGGIAPANTVLPAISGSTVVGNVLSTTNGTWNNIPTSFTYQWYSAGSPIGGATSSTYTSQVTDVGNTITVIVTATNATGSTPATSGGAGPITASAGTVATTNIMTMGA